MEICWYKDSITKRYLENHDVSTPTTMSPGELVETLTYIEELQCDSEYARELCRRAGNTKAWEHAPDYETRSKAVQAAVKAFGYLM